MGKKDKEKKPKPKTGRIVLFLAIAAGLIYWLSGQITIDADENKLGGFSSVEGQVMGTELEIEKKSIDQILPEIVQKQVDKINQRFYNQGDQVIKEVEVVIKETKLAEEIEKIITQTTNEIEGFPDKQKKDIKKEAIRQVCDALMKEVENDQDKE